MSTAVMVEMSVPWEEGMDTALNLDDSCHQAIWKATVFPVESGCLAEEAEQGSFFNLDRDLDFQLL